MQELRYGKISNDELAEWFGLKPASFRNCKAKKLEELKQFAKFHLDKGKVVITEIYSTGYKSPAQIRYEEIRDKIDKVWSPSGLDSCRNVATTLLADDDTAERQVYDLVRRGRNELYGVPYSEVAGTIGTSIYMWCKQNPDGSLDFFTEEEQKIKDELVKQYFGNVNDKQIIIKAMVDNGEISAAEAWGKLEEMTNMGSCNFMKFLSDLQSRINCRIIRGTYVTRGEESLIGIE